MEVRQFTFAELDEIRQKQNPTAMLNMFAYNYCQLIIEKGECNTVNILDEHGKVKYQFTNAKEFNDKRNPIEYENI